MGQAFVNVSIVLQPPAPWANGQDYLSGTSIHGHLVTELIAPISFERISVNFCGKGEVNCLTGAAAIRDRYQFGGEVYCDETQILSGQAERGHGQSCLTLTAGRHSLPFCFNIPSSAPSSVEGGMGFIRYALQGRLLTADGTSYRSAPTAVPVVRPVNVAESHLLEPKQQQVQNTVSYYFFCASPVALTVAVPKTGYCIGEEIRLHVSIENCTRRRIYLTASVKEHIVYSSQGTTPVTNFGEQTVTTVKSGPMASRASREWNPRIKIPKFPAVDTSTSQVIQVSYLLTVTATISQSQSQPILSTSIPLKLGYEPLPIDTLPPPTYMSSTLAPLVNVQPFHQHTTEHFQLTELTKASATGTKLYESAPYSYLPVPPQSPTGLPPPSYEESISQYTQNA